MPVTPTYPGVYIEEIPSGVRTITGVATSITAFLGRTLRGPVDDPVVINSYADFEREFGGLNVNYPMSYAVKDFYANGGSQAIIIRLFVGGEGAPDVLAAITGNDPKAAAQAARDVADSDANKDEPRKSITNAVATAAEEAANLPNATVDDVRAAAAAVAKKTGLAKFDVGELHLVAAGPGTWGNRLAPKIYWDGLRDDNEANEVIRRFGLPTTIKKEHLFNLTVIENPPDGQREVFRNVSLHPDAGSRRLDRVLEDGSSLVRAGDLPAAGDATRPAETAANADPTNRATKPGDIAWFGGGANSALLTGPADYTGLQGDKTGMYALSKADLFNLLCIPPDVRELDVPVAVLAEAMQYCADRRAMLIVDPPAAWGANPATAVGEAIKGLPGLGLSGLIARNAALYFPRIVEADPMREGQLDTFVPCGILAGVMARTDVQRGVWKAPAGLDAALNGVQALQVTLGDDENGQLNPLGINCLRFFPPVAGFVAWGARTARGADQLGDEYKYVPVRRLVLYIEESLYRGTKWVVFEPNDEPLWAQIRLNVGAFMHNLFRQGAFQGATPRDAYFVKCDKETTTQNDINLGIVNIVVGFAPLKPAEFVIIKIQQMAGQIEV